MNLMSPSSLSYYKNLSFDFSNTMRNEKVNIEEYASSGYVIDVNGEIYSSGSIGGDSATIVIIGGSDRFINEKTSRLESTFYMSEPQKLTLYKIIKEISMKLDSVNITSNNNDKLEQSLCALYKNYCE
jgi:hypothetical protein